MSLKIPEKTLDDNFLLKDFQDDFVEIDEKINTHLTESSNQQFLNARGVRYNG